MLDSISRTSVLWTFEHCSLRAIFLVLRFLNGSDKDLPHPVAVQFPEPEGYCIPFRESAEPVDIK